MSLAIDLSTKLRKGNTMPMDLVPMEMLPSLSKGKSMQTPLQFATKDVEVFSKEDEVFRQVVK